MSRLCGLCEESPCICTVSNVPGAYTLEEQKNGALIEYRRYIKHLQTQGEIVREFIKTFTSCGAEETVVVKKWALETALKFLSHHGKAESPPWYNVLMDSLSERERSNHERH